MQASFDNSRLLFIHLHKSIRYYGRKYFYCIKEWVNKYSPVIKERLKLYISLTRLDKPIGALLLLWPTLWALWLSAEGFPSLHILFVFVLGVFLTRSAGCIANDMADYDFDSQVERTKDRPLTSGELSKKEALLVALGLLSIAFLLVIMTNRFTVYLSIAAVPIAIIYPFMKRITYIPQFFLGIVFSWGILMAFTAQTNSIPNIAWLLFIANVLWVVIYDTIYAMVDRKDDVKIGIKSTAILFDDADRTFIGIFQLMMLIVLTIIGIQINADLIYYVCMVPVGCYMIYHQYLIRHRLPKECFRAFMNNNWLGMSVFAGFLFNFL